MRRGGIAEEEIRKVTYDNPLAAYGQSGQIQESDWLDPPPIDQRRSTWATRCSAAARPRASRSGRPGIGDDLKIAWRRPGPDPAAAPVGPQGEGGARRRSVSQRFARSRRRGSQGPAEEGGEVGPELRQEPRAKACRYAERAGRRAASARAPEREATRRPPRGRPAPERSSRDRCTAALRIPAAGPGTPHEPPHGRLPLHAVPGMIAAAHARGERRPQAAQGAKTCARMRSLKVAAGRGPSGSNPGSFESTTGPPRAR